MPKLPEDKTNAELEAGIEQLEQQIQKTLPVPGSFDGSTALPGDRLASQLTREEISRAQVIRDPWAVQNAMKILAHPPGRHLQWLNPGSRARRGMRGWTAVQHDDAIGRELHLYVTDPPSRMEGSAKQDNIVRRGDAILGWIDEGIWLARQNRRVDKSNRALMKDKTQQQFGPNGRTYGDGVSDDPRPRERSAPGFISPKRLAEYRERAKGTITDSQIVTPGRRMLDPYEPQGE